jgi:hypothetical protein
MKESNTKRSTGNEIQRTVFLSTLRDKLSKIADVHAKIYATANNYMSQGMNEMEVEELLLIDGYHPDLIKTCMASLGSEEHIAVAGKRWGFNVEDFYGRIVSHAELNANITAESEEEAWEKAEEFIANADAENGMDRIIEVYEIS